MTSAVIDTGGPGLEFDSNGIKKEEVRKKNNQTKKTKQNLFTNTLNNFYLSLKENCTVNSCVKWTRNCCMGYDRADHFSRISYLIYYCRGVEAVSFEVCGTTVDWAYKNKFCTKHLFKVKISDVSWGRMRQAKQYKDHFQCICFYFCVVKKKKKK